MTIPAVKLIELFDILKFQYYEYSKNTARKKALILKSISSIKLLQ